MLLKVFKLAIAVFLSLGTSIYTSLLNNNISTFALMGMTVAILVAIILMGSFLSDLYIDNKRANK